jgi:hypothetical protein
MSFANAAFSGSFLKKENVFYTDVISYFLRAAFVEAPAK